MSVYWITYGVYPLLFHLNIYTFYSFCAILTLNVFLIISVMYFWTRRQVEYTSSVLYKCRDRKSSGVGFDDDNYVIIVDFGNVKVWKWKQISQMKENERHNCGWRLGKQNRSRTAWEQRGERDGRRRDGTDKLIFSPWLIMRVAIFREPWSFWGEPTNTDGSPRLSCSRWDSSFSPPSSLRFIYSPRFTWDWWSFPLIVVITTVLLLWSIMHNRLTKA